MAENTDKAKQTLRSFFKDFLVADLVFAAGLGLLQTLVLNQIGYVVGANHLATNVGAGLAFIPSFFFGMFYFAFASAFMGVIMLGWAWFFDMVTDHGHNAVLKPFFEKFYFLAAGCVLVWAALHATLTAIVLNQAGMVAHANVAAVWVATVLAWGFAFFIGLFQGVIGATVLTGFALVILLAACAIFGSGKKTDTTTETKTDGTN